ncbi:hypothetical protein HPB128_142g38 [Helicobacter pylori B128]|nr:hypothetical protein HPB128_142g38 [Helicobacter pylori B128]
MSKVVRLAGLEPATYGLEGCCSIQLSYKRMVFGVRWCARRESNP